MNCHGNGNVDLVEGSINVVKSKKGTHGEKENTNQKLTANNVSAQQGAEASETAPAKPKKNKKKNKNSKNITVLSNGEGTTTNHNNNKSVDLPQSKNKRNSGQQSQKRGTSSNNLVSEIAKAREHIKNSLEKMDGITTLNHASTGSSEVYDRLAVVEKENAELKKLIETLKNLVSDAQKRIAALESHSGKKAEAEDDDGVDLFASDSEEENEEAARVREERLAAYAAKKSKKPALIAKSSLVLDVKPWDDETDLKVMEAEIRKITADGLLWGASKFLPVAFGIKKLSISCVVEDDKISIDWLTEEIEKMEDYVQSVDVAAFNKI